MKNFLTRRNDNDGWGLNFFDSDFEDFFTPSFFGRKNREMRTDIKETDKDYQLSIDMPGFDKKDIELSLENGYLTISANRNEKEENKDNYVRRERSFSCSRSYYVGDGVTEKDVKAKYENGTLALVVPKKEQENPKKRRIEIE